MKYHVEKSIEINAPTKDIRVQIEDFNKWNTWSPWVIAEPSCPTKIEGTAGDIGHSMFWDGEIIGSGKNTIINNNEQGIHYDLEFIKPWKSKAKTSFLLEEMGNKTKVTWTMDSSMPFFLFFMIKTMRNWIGMDYDRGLKTLKAVVEKGEVKASTTNNGVVDYSGFSYVGIKKTVPFSEIPTQIREDFQKIVQDVVMKEKKSAKHWVCLYPKFDMRNMVVTYVVAVSDEELKEIDLGPEYIRDSIKNTKALEIKHDGSYDFLGNAWSMGMMYTRAKKMKTKDVPFEQYWNSPMEVEPEELKTSVFFPIKD